MLTEMVIKNEAASMPLTLNLVVTCNTAEEEIKRNVLANSKNVRKWVKQAEAHDRTLLICGSGASICWDVEIIRQMQADGCEVWGLNNCANWLESFGILADAQVIMDAQPRTAELVGNARSHLFASQVNPALFELKPNAILWHATYGDKAVDEFEGFPLHDDEYCLIGSSISVGNTSLVLAYAMGYRNIHIFGMDSSHADTKSHVMHQSINDGDPLTLVRFGAKEYTCSLTMKLQAENFMIRASALKEAGCTLSMHGSGLLPDMFKNLSAEMDEKAKYEQMWSLPIYREHSPGECVVESFLELIKPSGKVIDFGCGTGRAAIKIKEYGCDVLLLDFTENSRDPAARVLPFAQQDLTQPIHHRADFGYCTDVMEHLPTDSVGTAIDNIMSASHRVFFQISTVPDSMGVIIGQQLHLTVKPHSWWAQVFKEKGYSINWEACFPSESQFYITKGATQ